MPAAAFLPLLLGAFFGLAEAVRKVTTPISTLEDSFRPETDIGSDSAADAESICAESEGVRTATSTLKQLLPEQEPGTLQVSAAQISDYFVASETTVRAFLEALAIETPNGTATESIEVSSLCKQSLKYVTQVLKWPLPDWRGHFCAVWSSELSCLDWVPVDGKAVRQKAQQLDLATELSHLHKNEADEEPFHMEREVVNESASNTSSHRFASTLDYSADDLAVQIANLFNVFPSEPGQMQTASSSFLEASEDAPPSFGPRVRRERYPIWRDTMVRSEAWVDNAFRNMAAHPKFMEAWFGSSSPAMQKEVRRVIGGMKKTLGKTKIKVGGSDSCNPRSATMAYVMCYQRRDGSFAGGEMDCQSGGRCRDPSWYVINICPRYWMPEFWNQDSSRYGTMVHESAHHHGPDDVAYKGAGAYGRAQCLRMAGEAPKEAVNNADNFMWYVYYLNRCAGARRSKPLAGAPCDFYARHATSRGRRVATSFKFVCDGRPVAGLTVKVLKSSGQYARQAENFGDKPQQRAWMSEEIELPPLRDGQTLALFYESDCAFWEARASASALGSNKIRHRAKVVTDMVSASGGSTSRGWFGGGEDSSALRADKALGGSPLLALLALGQLLMEL